MFKFWTTKEGAKTVSNYQGSFNNSEFMDERIGQMLAKEVKEKLVTAWIEENGAALLGKITPDEVEKSIKKAVAERIIR